MRSTPLLIQIYIVYFGLLPALDLDPTPFFAGVLALGIHFSTYTSEVYRAGIDSVHARVSGKPPPRSTSG